MLNFGSAGTSIPSLSFFVSVIPTGSSVATISSVEMTDDSLRLGSRSSKLDMQNALRKPGTQEELAYEAERRQRNNAAGRSIRNAPFLIELG